MSKFRTQSLASALVVLSAATLASAAQNFGQEDDILVLRIQREPESAGVMDARTTIAAT